MENRDNLEKRNIIMLENKNHFIIESFCLKTTIILSFIFSLASFAKVLPPADGVKITKGAMYRSTEGRTGVFKKTGITDNPKIKWTADIGGKIKSSPVVFEGFLYIGGKDGIYAIDTDTGTIKWKYPVKGGINSSACVANETVLFQGNGKVFALDAKTGKKKWIYKSKAKRNKKEPNYSSPAVIYGYVYVAVATEVVVLDFNTGKKIHKVLGFVGKRRNRASTFYLSLAFGKDKYYAGDKLSWGYIYGHEYDTGRCVWKTIGPFEGGAGVYFYKTPAATEEGVYFSTTRGLRKFHPKKGFAKRYSYKKVWYYKEDIGRGIDPNEFFPHSSPSIWDGVVYAGRYSGKFLAINDKDGKLKWEKKFSKSINSDPAIATESGIVYFGCDDNYLYALNAKTGKEKWSFKTNGEIFASPWIEDGAVYIASEDGKVYALTK